MFTKLHFDYNYPKIDTKDSSLSSQGHNFYKLKYISLEEVKIVPFQQ